VAGLDDLGLLEGGETAAVLLEDEPADAVAAEVVGQDVALPGLGQVPAAGDLTAAVLGAAGVEAIQDAREAVGTT
jgi:hypothetical protein